MNGFMRYVMILVVTLIALHSAGPVIAHEGAHTPAMLARVTSAVQQEDRVAVSIELTGLGGPLVLIAVSAPGAQAARLDPVYVNFAEDVAVHTVLTFDAPPPDIFTLMLDFGPVGQGALTVIPEPGPVPEDPKP